MKHFHRHKRLAKAKTKNQRNALHRLNSFLNANQKKPARFLLSMWKDQEQAITYKELREAILCGQMSEEEFVNWQSDYVAFFNSYLREELEKATYKGGKDIAAALLSNADLYRPMTTGIDNWISVHGAEWITQMSDEAKDAVSSMIRYTAEGHMTVDELARVIRPTIGLTEPQALANARYYEKVKSKLMKDNPTMKEATAAKRARDAAARYAGRQHRARAQTIAETELAYAYNKGADDAVHQAQREGLLPKMRSVWSTADDEGVCGICGSLDGVTIDHGDSFDYPGHSFYGGQKQTPPAHPHCRCALCYEECSESDFVLEPDIVEYELVDSPETRYMGSGISPNDWNDTVPIAYNTYDRQNLANYIKSKGFKVEGTGQFDGDIAFAKEYVDQIASLLEEYPLDYHSKKKIMIAFSRKMEDDEFAMLKSRRFQFNTKAMRSKTILIRNLQEGAEFSSVSPLAVARHEFGHLIEFEYHFKGIDIAEKAWHNIGADQTEPDLLVFLFKNVSPQSTEDANEKNKNITSGRRSKPKYLEITAEVFAKHMESPTEFTTEYIRLVVERGKKYRGKVR